MGLINESGNCARVLVSLLGDWNSSAGSPGFEACGRGGRPHGRGCAGCATFRPSSGVTVIGLHGANKIQIVPTGPEGEHLGLELGGAKATSKGHFKSLASMTPVKC